MKPLRDRPILLSANADRVAAVGTIVLLCLGSLLAASARAGGLTLRSGFKIEGRPAAATSISTNAPADAGELSVDSIIVVDAGMRRYYVRKRDVVALHVDAELARYEKFRLPQPPGGNGFAPDQVPPPLKLTSWDEQGRREITLRGARGPQKYLQGIYEIGPQFMRVRTQGLIWEFGIATTSIPTHHLDRMIRSTIDTSRFEDRRAIAMFYLQAGLYLQALIELEAIEKDFPDHQEQVEQASLQARQLLAQTLLKELEERRAAGQHALASAKSRQFPTERMSASVLRQVREFAESYEQARNEIDLINVQLGELQAELKDERQRELVDVMRVEVAESLSMESLPRLRPFQLQADDPDRPADEKLALAYSGWLLGEARAIDTLSQAINLWLARFDMLQYLRSEDSIARRQILAGLLDLEGVTTQSVLDLVPNLPPILSTPGIQPGVATRITVADFEGRLAEVVGGDSKEPVEAAYHVLLPTEYSPDHSYPVIVALHGVERNPEWELRWWGGTADEPLQSQRRGYIVIAPEYLDAKATSYQSSAATHERIELAIRDARLRFNVNSDRVFLAGHGTGADAAFEIGCANPDIFAAVIPISGEISTMVKRLDDNAKLLPWYIVNGQLDRDVFGANARTIDRWMKKGFDVVDCEFVGRGYESFYAEIHNLFDWMELYHRQPQPKEFTFKSIRSDRSRYFWLDSSRRELSPRVRNVARRTPTAKEPSAISSSPKNVACHILDGAQGRTHITVNSSGQTHTLWLSPEMINFNDRLQVSLNGASKYNDFVEESIEAVLEDFRRRGDRQRIYRARIELQ
ncbi:hypothetical protein GC176_18475 [bacterium]|nr:hypothetical protein [bacterium]